jgi:hypothetical protein
MDVHGRPELLSGNEIDFRSGVGTRGLGPGTFAFIDITPIPSGLRPHAEFEFPAKTPDAKPVHLDFEIPKRC